jgi:hypothetical protein
MTTFRAVLPREYGAYAELAFPLLTAFLLGGVTVAGVGFTLAVVAGFLVREPLALMNGVRGMRLETTLGAQARRAAWVLGALGVVGAAGGMALAPSAARVAALVPGALGILLAPALLRGRPKTLGVELLVAGALATMMVPVGVSGSMGWGAAWRAAAVWAASFALATLAVHAIKARAKPDVGTGWALRATPAFALLSVAGGLLGGAVGRIPVAVGIAVVPSALVVLAATALGTHPRRLKRVGWSLAAANAITLVLLLS